MKYVTIALAFLIFWLCSSAMLTGNANFLGAAMAFSLINTVYHLVTSWVGEY